MAHAEKSGSIKDDSDDENIELDYEDFRFDTTVEHERRQLLKDRLFYKNRNSNKNIVHYKKDLINEKNVLDQAGVGVDDKIVKDSDVQNFEVDNGVQVVNKEQLNIFVPENITMNERSEVLKKVRINCLNECTHYKKKRVKINGYVIKMLEKVQSNYFK